MLEATIPISSFLRFYEATPAHKVRLVQDSREQRYNRQGYVYRDYYRGIRDSMKTTHWQTNELDAFKRASGHFPIKSTELSKIENYEQISKGYIGFVEKSVERVFELPSATEKFANLLLRITLDVGIETLAGEKFALKLWYPSKGPTRLYRQGFEHLASELGSEVWDDDVRPAILDVRRGKILNPIKPPRDIDLSLRGQAAAFEAIWNQL